MRFLITAGVDPNKKSQGEPHITDELIAAYMKFNEDLHRAGVLVTAEGLSPQGGRARVVTDGDKRTVVDGPFTETKELLGGFYLIDVASKEEAVQWALRCPVGLGTDDVLELYQLTDLADIPAAMVDLCKRVAPTWTESVLHPKRRGLGD